MEADGTVEEEEEEAAEGAAVDREAAVEEDDEADMAATRWRVDERTWVGLGRVGLMAGWQAEDTQVASNWCCTA